MKQNAMRTFQPKVLRSAIVTMALALIVLAPFGVLSQTSTGDAIKQQSSNSSAEQELINLSKEKWRWMSERKVADVKLTPDDFRQIENITSRVEVEGARYSEGAQKLVNR